MKRGNVKKAHWSRLASVRPKGRPRSSMSALRTAERARASPCALVARASRVRRQLAVGVGAAVTASAAFGNCCEHTPTLLFRRLSVPAGEWGGEGEVGWPVTLERRIRTAYSPLLHLNLYSMFLSCIFHLQSRTT